MEKVSGGVARIVAQIDQSISQQSTSQADTSVDYAEHNNLTKFLKSANPLIDLASKLLILLKPS